MAIPFVIGILAWFALSQKFNGMPLKHDKCNNIPNLDVIYVATWDPKKLIYLYRSNVHNQDEIMLAVTMQNAPAFGDVVLLQTGADYKNLRFK